MGILVGHLLIKNPYILALRTIFGSVIIRNIGGRSCCRSPIYFDNQLLTLWHEKGQVGCATLIPMKITVLGPGKMGSALATNWKAKGNDVTVSMFRDEQKHLRWNVCGISVEKSIEKSLSDAEVVLISCPYNALQTLYPMHALFEGKTVITCVNALVPDLTGATVGLEASMSMAVAEEIQERIPGARVVEAFNVAFSANLSEGRKDFQGHYGSIFYCGDDRLSKDITASLIQACEYEAVNAGPLISARTLETLSTAWLQFAVASGLFPRVSIKMLKR